MKLVRDTPAGIDIYSDAQDGIWFATGRVTYALPRTDGGLKPKPHPDRGGICIWFHVGRSYYRRPGDFRDRALYSRRLGGAFVMELDSAQGEEKEDGLGERPRGYPLTAARRLRPGRAPATSLPDSIDTPAVGHKLVMSAVRGFLHRRSK